MPLDFSNAQNMRYSISVQRELPGQWLLEVGYAGSRGWDMTTGGGGKRRDRTQCDPGAVPVDAARSRDQATINFLDQNVTNPFRGLLPAPASTAPPFARSQLLRPFPQFGNVPTFDDDGTSRYDSVQMKLEKRFTSGYTILGAYTWSQFTERVFRLNPTDTDTRSGCPNSTCRTASRSAASASCRSARAAVGQ